MRNRRRPAEACEAEAGSDEAGSDEAGSDEAESEADEADARPPSHASTPMALPIWATAANATSGSDADVIRSEATTPAATTSPMAIRASAADRRCQMPIPAPASKKPESKENKP